VRQAMARIAERDGKAGLWEGACWRHPIC
jgi:hypothetical protein